MPIKVIIITAGTQITLPSDWNSANNSIECIGGRAGRALDLFRTRGWARLRIFAYAGRNWSILAYWSGRR